MGEIKFEKGPVEIEEIAGYIIDLRDAGNTDSHPKLRFKGNLFYITEVLNGFKGKRRMVTIGPRGQKMLFDVAEPLFFDGEEFNFQSEYVEMTWREYYKYWTAIPNSPRPDSIHWLGDPYIVYSFTKITGEDALYVVVGSKPNERITLRFDQFTVITRAANEVGTGAGWTVEHAKQVVDGRKWD